MNREIKFRVWDNVDYMSKPFTLQEVQSGKIQFTSDCAVMQFTGLKDKNGKEIYEGDVVRFFIDFDIEELERRSEVEYKDGSFSLETLSETEDKIRVTLFEAIGHGYIDNRVEIIGNIYENPDLLP